MDLILSEIRGNRRFDVYVDHDSYYADFHGIDAIEFESEDERLNYIAKVESGEIGIYLVEMLEKCKCCDSFVSVDAVGSIHEGTPEQAISYYAEYYAPKEVEA